MLGPKDPRLGMPLASAAAIRYWPAAFPQGHRTQREIRIERRAAVELIVRRLRDRAKQLFCNCLGVMEFRFPDGLFDEIAKRVEMLAALHCRDISFHRVKRTVGTAEQSR